jgi:hypothetical protein
MLRVAGEVEHLRRAGWVDTQAILLCRYSQAKMCDSAQQHITLLLTGS